MIVRGMERERERERERRRKKKENKGKEETIEAQSAAGDRNVRNKVYAITLHRQWISYTKYHIVTGIKSERSKTEI